MGSVQSKTAPKCMSFGEFGDIFFPLILELNKQTKPKKALKVVDFYYIEVIFLFVLQVIFHLSHISELYHCIDKEKFEPSSYGQLSNFLYICLC